MKFSLLELTYQATEHANNLEKNKSCKYLEKVFESDKQATSLWNN